MSGGGGGGRGGKLRATPLPAYFVPGKGHVAKAGLGSLLPSSAGAPNTPGNVAGSLPPGTAEFHRLPELTWAHLC